MGIRLNYSEREEEEEYILFYLLNFLEADEIGCVQGGMKEHDIFRKLQAVHYVQNKRL